MVDRFLILRHEPGAVLRGMVEGRLAYRFNVQASLMCLGAVVFVSQYRHSSGFYVRSIIACLRW